MMPNGFWHSLWSSALGQQFKNIKIINHKSFVYLRAGSWGDLDVCDGGFIPSVYLVLSALLLCVIPVTEATFPSYTSLEYPTLPSHYHPGRETSLVQIIIQLSMTSQTPANRSRPIWDCQDSKSTSPVNILTVTCGHNWRDLLNEAGCTVYNNLFQDKTLNIETYKHSSLLPPAGPDGAVTGDPVLHLQLVELVAPDPPSHRTEGGAELVPAPHQPVPHVPEVVARPEASQSLPAAGAEPIQSFFQSGSAGTYPLPLPLLGQLALLLLLLLVCLGRDLTHLRTCHFWASQLGSVTGALILRTSLLPRPHHSRDWQLQCQMSGW